MFFLEEASLCCKVNLLIKSVPAFSDMRLFNKDRARGVATQVGSCPAIPAASNHKDAAMVQRLAVQHLRPPHLSATLPLHLVQDELAEHLPKRNSFEQRVCKETLG